MPPKITRAVSNIAISKAFIDHENPDRCGVTAYEKYIVSTSSRSYNGVLGIYAPSTALRKCCLVFTSGRWSTKTGRGCSRYMSEREGFDEKRTNQSLRVTEAARIFDETLTNN